MTSTRPTRIRRLSMRLAVAGALVAVPLGALAIPASAESTDSSGIAVATQVSDQDWNHDRGGDNRDNRDRHDHRGDRGPDQPQPQPAPLPSTGSFG